MALLDTFTDANGTALASHTMDTGAGWTVHGQTWQINSNRVSQTATDGQVGLATAQASESDLTAYVTIRMAALTLAYPGLVFRFVDASNFWILRADAGSGENQLNLYEVTAGSYTLRTTAPKTWAINTDYELKVITSGTSIQVYLDGVLEDSYTSSAHQAGTRVGMGSYTSNGTFDLFTVPLTTPATVGWYDWLRKCLGWGHAETPTDIVPIEGWRLPRQNDGWAVQAHEDGWKLSVQNDGWRISE